MMLYKGIRNRFACFALILGSTTAQSGVIGDKNLTNPISFLDHFELSAAGGFDALHTKNTELIISPYETDSVKIHHINNKGIWNIGLGYYLFEEQLASRSYLNHLLLELNYYATSATLDGSVWQFDLPQFDNYTFETSISSTRLMLDIKPTLFTWNQLEPYPIVGVGMVWNKTAYSEKVSEEGIDPDSRLSLSHHSRTQLGWDLGAGIRFLITRHISAKAEYVYAVLDHGSPADEPEHKVNLSSPPVFSLHTQSLLFGLNVIL